MKGRITAYDPETYRGEIQGHDGEQHGFVLQDWKESDPPKPETAVDFVPDGYNNAKSIYFDDEVLAILSKYPEDVSLWPSTLLKIINGTIATFCSFFVVNLIRNGLFDRDGRDPPDIAIIAPLALLVGAVAVPYLVISFADQPPVYLSQNGINYRSNAYWRVGHLWAPWILSDNRNWNVKRITGDIQWGVAGLSKKDMRRLVLRWCSLRLGELEAAAEASTNKNIPNPSAVESAPLPGTLESEIG